MEDLNGEKISGTYYEKQLQKSNQREFKTKKVINKKSDHLYVKWKGNNNLFNTWIDKKRQYKSESM